MHHVISLPYTSEIIKGMRSSAEIVILDFNEISPSFPQHKNIARFFERCAKEGRDPRSAKERQQFNDCFLRISGKKVLIGRYGEDRAVILEGSSMAREGRTIHLGIDLFTTGLEEVFCPLDGEVVSAGFEPGPHGYGYWIIIKHLLQGETLYTFYGHLGKRLYVKKIVRAEDCIGNLGDFVDGENGGWSRHLHFQLLDSLPSKGAAPNGYATQDQFRKRQRARLDPARILNIPLADAN